MRKIKRIIVHHSESEGGDVDFLRYCHVHDNKWKDVGYHYVITNGKKHGDWKAGMDGMIQEGRPVEMVGAHAKGANSDSIGICVIGDFEETKPTYKQIASLSSLLIELCVKHNINPFGNILGHRDVNNTTCPGRYLYSILMPMKLFITAALWHEGQRW